MIVMKIFFLKSSLSNFLQIVFLQAKFECVEASHSFNFFKDFIPQSRVILTCVVGLKILFETPLIHDEHLLDFLKCHLMLIYPLIEYKFFYKKNFYKKMSLKNPKTLRKCLEYLQPQMSELQFLKALIFPELFQSYKAD